MDHPFFLPMENSVPSTYVAMASPHNPHFEAVVPIPVNKF